MQQGELTLLLGVTGSGKSTGLAKSLSRAECDRVLLLDLKDEFGSVAGFRRHEGSRALLSGLDRGGTFGLERVVPGRSAAQRRADLAALSEFAYVAGDCTLIVDEATAYFAGAEDVLDEFENLAYRGRAAGVDVVVSTQRPCRIPTSLPSQARHFVVYRLDHAPDLALLRRELDLADDVVERVRVLPLGAFLDFYRGFQRKAP